MSDVDTTRHPVQLRLPATLDMSNMSVEKLRVIHNFGESQYEAALDDLLEAMPEKRPEIDWVAKSSITKRTAAFHQLGLDQGFNKCHDQVTATIHQLKSSKKGEK